MWLYTMGGVSVAERCSTTPTVWFLPWEQQEQEVTMLFYTSRAFPMHREFSTRHFWPVCVHFELCEWCKVAQKNQAHKVLNIIFFTSSENVYSHLPTRRNTWLFPLLFTLSSALSLSLNPPSIYIHFPPLLSHISLPPPHYCLSPLPHLSSISLPLSNVYTTFLLVYIWFALWPSVKLNMQNKH